MSVNFIGMVTTHKNSEIHPSVGPAIDTDYLLRLRAPTKRPALTGCWCRIIPTARMPSSPSRK